MEITWNGDYVTVNGTKVFAPKYQSRSSLILSLRQRADRLNTLGKTDEGSAHHLAADFISSPANAGSLI